MNYRGFGSDNHAPIHPELMASLNEANQHHAASYGTDTYSEKALATFKNLFSKETDAHFVFNGTAANVLSLRALMQRHQACLVSDMSHLLVDECGAPEFFAGKLIPVKTQQGKLTVTELKKHLIRQGDQHYSPIKAISLTQPTEVGTVYSLDELKSLCDWAHSHNLAVHMDGARFANALVYLRCSPHQMTVNCGVDILSLGGTKNGFLFGEAVLIFNKNYQKDFKYLRKQSAQLPSKTRFIACQFETYLSTGLYKKIADHSLQMAQILQKNLNEFHPELEITYPVQCNSVFVKIPQKYIKALKEVMFFYVWTEIPHEELRELKAKNIEPLLECRLMMSWDTQPEDINLFIKTLTDLKAAPHGLQL